MKDLNKNFKNNFTNSDLIPYLHRKFNTDLTKISAIISDATKSEEQLIPLISKHILSNSGKRLRPILMMITSKIFDYKGDKQYLLASAIELIHVATLLHDDIIDNSTIRRFAPAAHTIWGQEAGILIGDFLFTKSFELMVKTKCFESLKVIAGATSNIITGEVGQLTRLKANKLITESEYYKIIKKKTAILFAASCKVGAIISNQPIKVVKAIEEFGTLFGIIYQIIDDTLDYFSGEKEGKHLYKDFEEGKVTLPIILLKEKLDFSELENLKEIFFDTNNRTKENLNQIIYLLKKYNIINELLYILHRYQNNALNLLTLIKGNPDYRGLLCNILQYCIAKVENYALP